MFMTKMVSFIIMNNNKKIIFQRIKRAPIYLLVLFLFMINLNDLITFSAFKLNQDFIAKVFCINREKPQLKCNGKCHLKKELKKNNSSEKSEPANSPMEKQEQKINFFSDRITSDGQEFGNTRKQFCDIEILVSFLNETDIFHPPRVSFI